jgi:hypothetical protein
VQKLPEHLSRIETARFGPVTSRVGLSGEALQMALTRVQDAQDRFRSSPLAQVADRLDKEVVVSSVFGTNSIEGGTLSEEETRVVLDLGTNGPEDRDAATVQDIERRRARNIKRAYSREMQRRSERAPLKDRARCPSPHGRGRASTAPGGRPT